MKPPPAPAFHDSRESAARDRGFGLGRAHHSAVANTVTVYRRLFAEAGVGAQEVLSFGRSVGALLEESEERQQVDEIEGIAASAGVEPAELLAINARTELLVGRTASECSLIGLEPRASEEGRCVLAQNWDWHPDLAPSTLLWRVKADAGSFVTLTEAGVLAKIGLNDRRVCCGLNFLASSEDGRVPTADAIHLILRRILERAGSLAEAVAIVEAAQPTASAAVTIGWGQPWHETIVNLELTPSRLQRSGAAVTGSVTHTNHFLADLGPISDLTGVGEDLAHSVWRLGQLERIAVERPSTSRVRDLLASHGDESYGMCAHEDTKSPWASRYATLATVIIDASACEMWVSDGQPCSAEGGRAVALDTLVT